MGHPTERQCPGPLATIQRRDIPENALLPRAMRQKSQKMCQNPLTSPANDGSIRVSRAKKSSAALAVRRSGTSPYAGTSDVWKCSQQAVGIFQHDHTTRGCGQTVWAQSSFRGLRHTFCVQSVEALEEVLGVPSCVRISLFTTHHTTYRPNLKPLALPAHGGSAVEVDARSWPDRDPRRCTGYRR